MRKYTSLQYKEEWVPEGNFDTSRKSIDRIVIHTIIGTVASATARFGKTGTQVSAHYAIGLDGSLTAYIEEYYTAYHSGNYAMNQRSIGIEHEDNGKYTQPRTDALYETSGKLVADICREYNIPCDREHIVKHNEITATGCPHNLDIDRIIRQAKEILQGGGDMEAKIREKSSSFDKIVHYLFEEKLVEQDNSNIYTFEQIRDVIKKQFDKVIEQDNLIKNLNQQVNDRNNDITRLTAEVSTLTSQLKEVITQKDLALEQAEQVPSLTEQIAHLEEKVKGQQGEIESLTRAIGQYKQYRPKHPFLLKAYDLIMSLDKTIKHE